MKYTAILGREMKEIDKKMNNLFRAIDLLCNIGEPHVEERRIHNQRYQELKKNLVPFWKSKESYDLEMLNRTNKYRFCPI
ncbi:hypothetical protein GOV13_01415 [Candidatus Pacearchaeota archaeon]|nr:hypothetical protein [Candidatus Pacearchaeota archaeon]